MKSSLASPANLSSAKFEGDGRFSSPLEPISRDLILEINFTDRWSDIVRVKPLLRRYMFKSDFGSLENFLEGKIIPGVRGWCVRFGPVYNSPIVIVVFVWVERDLLFCLLAFERLFNANQLTL